MKAKLDERKAKVLTIITVCFLIILVITASFAYFQAQVGNGASTSINATTGTTDVLTFYNEDLDVASIENNNIVDSDGNIDIVINANEDNFGINGKSLGDGVKAKAKLTANNTNNIAKMQKYNVFIVIDSNGIEYTQGDTRPELIMKVKDPDGTEVTNITGLKYHKADEAEANDVSGFDITGRTGGYAIKRDQEIEVKADDKSHYKEQEWKIEIILINLKGNQNKNGGKNVNGRILITTENQDTYELAHINSIKKYETTKDSISGELNYEEGTSHIKEYWYKINSLGTNEPMAITTDEEGYTLSETGAKFDFEDLDENTKYEISSYVVDEKGFKSDVYKTDVFKTESGEKEAIVTDKLPIIKEVTVSEMKYNSFKVEVTKVEKGTNEIQEYRYHISGGGKNGTETETSENNYYVFKNLSENQQYKVEIEAIDNKEQSSPKYSVEQIKTTTDTLPKIINVEATVQEANRLLFTITAQKGNNNITSYSCTLKQGETEKGTKEGTITNPDTTEVTCEFTELEPETEYTVEVTVTDSNGNESNLFSATGKTKKIGCDEGEDIQNCLVRLDKEQNPSTPTLIYHDNKADYPGMENADKEAGDLSYRYSGASASVNNYICLDGKTTDTQCGDEDLYRIIGLFKNSSNQYEIKVIKSSPATSNQLGKSDAYKTDTTYYWNNSNSSSSANKWSESNLNKVNLNTTFKADIEKKIGANKIVEHTWIVGGNTSTNIVNTPNMKTVYTNEITTPATNDTVSAKIGLMYASDYGYAASPTNWATQLYSYYDTPKNSNWMYMNNNTTEWTISHYSGNSHLAFCVSSAGHVRDFSVSSYAFAARPVFYLASSVTIASGNGSMTNPYRVSLTDGQF